MSFESSKKILQHVLHVLMYVYTYTQREMHAYLYKYTQTRFYSEKYLKNGIFMKWGNKLSFVYSARKQNLET